jgi:hypothetical protein
MGSGGSSRAVDCRTTFAMTWYGFMDCCDFVWQRQGVAHPENMDCHVASAPRSDIGYIGVIANEVRKFTFPGAIFYLLTTTRDHQ